MIYNRYEKLKIEKDFQDFEDLSGEASKWAIQGGGKCLGGWSLTWEVGETFLEYLRFGNYLKNI
jgi:hypothetical protein